jgi:hypothetical protein
MLKGVVARIRNIDQSFLLLVILGVTTSSILSAVLVGFDLNRPQHYNFLYTLPLVYLGSFLLVVIFVRRIEYRISVFSVLAIYWVKMVVTPLIMFLGSYSTFGVSELFSRYMNQAVLLMGWETVFIVLTSLVLGTNLFTRKPREKEGKFDILQFGDESIPQEFEVALWIILGYLVFVFLGLPGLFEETFFLIIGRLPNSYVITDHKIYGLFFGPQLVTISRTLIWIMQVILPPYLFLELSKFTKTNQQEKILFFSILGLTLIIATEGRAHSIESALAFLIAVTMLRRRIKINFTGLFAVIITIAAIGLMVKSNVFSPNSTLWSELSRIVTAYFSGPQNVAKAIAVASESDQLGIMRVFSDFLQQIPYLTKFFKPIFGGTTNTVFNLYFGGKYLGQIIPSIGLGYSYFGFVLAPIVPSIALFFSIHFEKRALLMPDIVRKTMYYLGAIMMVRATSMSSMLSGVTYLFYFLFMWTIIFFTYDRGVKIRRIFARINRTFMKVTNGKS